MKARQVVSLFAIALVSASLIGGCSPAEKQSQPAAVKEIAPGLLEGYLSPKDLPNSLELLPPPPDEGSVAFALDEEMSRKSLALRGTDRWSQAIEDANLHFPEAAEAFSGVIGIPVTEGDTPRLYMLMRRSLTDAGLSTYTAKNHYTRARPFMANGESICTPEDKEGLMKDGSYPSGHTAIGWAWALVLCEIFPEHTDAIIDRGRAFGESRMICNVHWQSDVNEGRFMGAATVARLHADPGFLADLEAAKNEVAAMRVQVSANVEQQ
jgi:acid phosphatase (class A)